MIDIERLSNQVSELLHKDVAQQWRGVHLYMEKIRGEVGDVLDVCRWLIDGNTVLSFDNFHNDILSFKGGKEGNNIVIISFWLLTHHYESIKEHESNPDGSQGLPSKYYDVENNFHYQLSREVWSMLPDEVRASEVDEYQRLIETCEYRGSLFLRYVLLTYLYIALNNECESIKEQALIEGVTLPSSPEIAPRLPHNERKEHEGAIIPPNKKRAPRAKEVFTERAKMCFQKAIGRGYMKQVSEGKYKWLLDESSKVSLVYFHMRVYDFKARWKEWEQLFDVTELKQSARGLRATHFWRYRHKESDRMYIKEPPPEPRWFTELYDFFDD